MIGADDLDDLYDPDEFGCELRLVEQGQQARPCRGMWSQPVKSGRLTRTGVDPNGATLRTRPDQRHLQIANANLPANWKTTKVQAGGAEWAITAAEPLGRLRTLLTLVPWGNGPAPVEDQSWRVSS